MGYDQAGLVWNPKVNTYDVPGCITLAGTQDPSPPTLIKAGDKVNFANPTLPTIAEINQCSHYNQVIAYANRRIQLLNTVAGKTLPTQIAYLTPDKRIRSSDYTTIASGIKLLRTYEQWIDLNVNMFTPLGTQVMGVHLARLRQGLGIRGVIKNIPGAFADIITHKDSLNHMGYYAFSDTNYPNVHTVPNDENINQTLNAFNVFQNFTCGKKSITLAGVSHMQRQRLFFQYYIPEFVTEPINAYVSVNIPYSAANGFIVNTLDPTRPTWLFLTWSGTDDSSLLLAPAYGETAFGAFFFGAAVLAAPPLNTAPNGVTYTANPILSDIIAQKGRRFCTNLCVYDELNGLGNSNTFANNGQSNIVTPDAFNPPSLTIDFGP